MEFAIICVVHRTAGVIRLPVNRLHVELTNCCDFSCEFCPDSIMKRGRATMPFEMLKSILESARGIATLVMFHVMGEPTLYPRLPDAARYAADLGHNVCITTNGSRIDVHLMNELYAAGVKEIIISLQTPDEGSFRLRGAKGLTFTSYAANVASLAKAFLLNGGHNTQRLTVSFLSSPLRRLLIPVAGNVSIADTSAALQTHLSRWAAALLKNSPYEGRLPIVESVIKKARCYKGNSVHLAGNLYFTTRIAGDWRKPEEVKIVGARIGYCPALEDNFGILCNGDYVFCCTDYDGATTTANFKDMGILDYLNSKPVQQIVKAFRHYSVIHPYCRRCIGDKSFLNSIVKQVGSILYFKVMR
ncbi:MAG: radical SAM protein [Nitrospirae bacterium]|nr:radical SAM protein [Nitrospirota bacterium]